MSKNIDKIVNIAATWWADKITNPKFDNGDPSNAGGLAMAFALKNTKTVEDSARSKFIERLSELIIEGLERAYKTFVLDVDYGADNNLRNAAEYAGIPDSNFPWKTTMWISENHVSVRYGYRAQQQYLYANKKYWQERINSSEEDIVEYENGNLLSWMNDKEEARQTAIVRVAELKEDIEQYKVELENAVA